jgi:hypothetical protein
VAGRAAIAAAAADKQEAALGGGGGGGGGGGWSNGGKRRSGSGLASKCAALSDPAVMSAVKNNEANPDGIAFAAGDNVLCAQRNVIYCAKILQVRLNIGTVYVLYYRASVSFSAEEPSLPPSQTDPSPLPRLPPHQCYVTCS